MFTNRKILAISLALTVSLALPPVTLAQEATAQTQEWSSLKMITAGSNLDVKLKDGKRVKGKLINASDTALSLHDRNKPTDLNRGDVLSVHRVSGTSAQKPALIGAGVGAAIGAGIGAGIHGNPDYSKPAVAAVFGAFGAGVGALVGYLGGKSRHKRALIYQAKEP